MMNWKKGRLGDLAAGYRGVSYTPSQLREFVSESTVTLLRSNNISDGKINFTDTQIVPAKIVAENQMLRPGDIAVCMSNGSRALVGKAAPFHGVDGGCYTVGAFCSVFKPIAGADAKYVSYVFQSQSYKDNIDYALAGTAINNLKNSDIDGFVCNVPPIREQITIAEILSCLDAKISSANQLVAKLKVVKQGLLQGLLTRGVDANGELRPDFKVAPHSYKNTSMGWLPVEWEPGVIDDVLSEAPRNGIYKPPGKIGKGMLLVGQTAFTDEGSVNFEYARRAVVDASEGKIFSLRAGDLLVSRVFATLEGVGQPVLVPELLEPAVFESNMMRLRVCPSKLIPRLLLHWLKQPYARQAVRSRAFLSNQASINRAGLGSVPVPLVPLDEQLEIEKRICSMEKQIRNETNLLAKLQSQKVALMDDLLTGRKRVTALLQDAV